MSAPPPTANRASVRTNKVFLALLIAVTAAFGWILWPFFGALFWGVVLAILFAPLYRWLLHRWRGRESLAALATLAVIVLIVLLPLGLLSASLVSEGAGFYQRMQAGELDVGRHFDQVMQALPSWVTERMNQVGLGNMVALKQKLTAAVSQGASLIATQALSIGQNTFEFIVNFFITIYLVFFLLRDGRVLARYLNAAIPLEEEDKRKLRIKFTTVIRAAVKGNVVVAIAQGTLGGLAFWALGVSGALLWGVVMAFLSLLPAIGAGLVWVPVALYLLATGELWSGLGLIAYGVLVIGMVDNVLRQVLVGKDTKMPDYVVLISTLGGMAVFGLNGFVIGPVIAAMFMAVWDICLTARGESE